MTAPDPRLGEIEALVELAARAIVASLPNDAEFEMHRSWATGYARAALEAAAPFLRAEALEESAEAWWLRDDVQDRFTPWSYLRARAAAVRGEG